MVIKLCFVTITGNEHGGSSKGMRRSTQPILTVTSISNASQNQKNRAPSKYITQGMHYNYVIRIIEDNINKVVFINSSICQIIE